MIVLDIETSGLNPEEHGIVSIGALCFDNPKKTFYQECRLDEEDLATETAMKINGISEEEARSSDRQTQKDLLRNFFQWVEEQKIRNLAGHNIGFFDLNFIKTRTKKYGLEFKTRYRSLDLCSVAQTRYYQVNGKFLLDDYRENAMGLSKVLEFAGIPDERIKFGQDELIKKGKSHNALEDAKLEAECFSRLLNGISLFPEYKKFAIPEYLKKLR